jgi:CubicO group peptidase (beta-lactamase class C family)
MTPPRDFASIADRLDDLFQPWNRSDAPGLVVGISWAGETLYRRGFGMASLETGGANGPATRMRIGSTSKHFTCLLLLLLAEEGRIDLNAPIRSYIPELAGQAGAPTIRQLMMHRGGGRDYVDLAFLTHGWNSTSSGAALRMQARQSEQNFALGTAMIYNNGGYHLLSIAAERAGGMAFEALLAERLFKPLGMRDTLSAPSDHVILPGMATLHMPGPDGQWRRGLFPSEEVKGEGAIVSTIDDMLRWAGHLRTRERFGTDETWQALLTPAAGADRALGAYALGLQLADYRGLRTISHSGGVVGGSCEMMTLPDQALEVIIMANGAPGANPSALALQAVDILLDGDLGPRARHPVAAEHADCLGEWWSPETGMVYGLVDGDGALKVEICSQPAGLDLLVAADGRVVLPESGIGEVEFMVDRLENDRLRIRFGSQTIDYQRLDRSTVDVAAFGRDVEGMYYCPDADATARFARHDGSLTIEIRDGHGSVSGPVTPLGPDVAGLGPLGIIYWCAITLERDAGRVTGFRVNAMRTRHLAFKRA